MSNTPRTDAATVRMERLDGDADVVVAAFFARQLERENADLRTQLENTQHCIRTIVDNQIVELTKARQQERERCAKVCDAGVDGAGRPYAEAIRALKEST